MQNTVDLDYRLGSCKKTVTGKSTFPKLLANLLDTNADGLVQHLRPSWTASRGDRVPVRKLTEFKTSRLLYLRSCRVRQARGGSESKQCSRLGLQACSCPAASNAITQRLHKIANQKFFNSHKCPHTAD